MTKIEGIPEGYELVRIGCPREGELYVTSEALVEMRSATSVMSNRNYPVVRKIEPPTPDPGEGWRLLDKNERIECDDEYSEAGGWHRCTASVGFRFGEAIDAGLLPAFEASRVRRRIESNQEAIVTDSTNYPSGLRMNHAPKFYAPQPEPPTPTYRPFANAEEFKPFRDRWIRYTNSVVDHAQRAVGYNCTDCFLSGNTCKSWEHMLRDFVFEDTGEPCGVKE